LTAARVLCLAEQLKRELPDRTVAQVRQIMIASGEPVPALRTLQRHFARVGLNVRADGRTPDKVYGRFEASARNELWTGDGERHEALWNRAVMKGHRGQFVAANWNKLGAAYPSERAEWVASSPDNDGTGQYCQMAWVRLARREGVREKPAAERLSSEFHQLQIWRIWAGQQRAPAHAVLCGELLDRYRCRRSGGHGEGLRRSRGDAAGAELGASPVKRF
jgi:hypothetical protein